MSKIIETTTVKNFYGQETKRKKIKDELFSDSILISEKESDLARSEKNDCVVRAFMTVLDIPYDSAHQWVKKNLKRVDRKGTYTSTYLPNILGKVKNHKRISLYGISPNKKYSQFKGKTLVNPKYKNKKTTYTVQSFMEDHPKGRYFIIVKGHALSLVDGVLYGNPSEQFNGFRRRIHYVLKIGK